MKEALYVRGKLENSIEDVRFRQRENHVYSSNKKQVSLLKKAVWLYFFLLIFEGALRKWILPQLETPLLIIRDPVAIWLIVASWKRGWLPFNPLLIGMVLIGIMGMVTAVLAGHGNMTVALYGARIFLLHFPLVFIIGRVFTREDVIKMGKTVLVFSIPMTMLIAVQFYSPQSAWVNRGVGGDIAGAGFSGALGYFRPPATFSFISGTVLFYGLATAFLLFFLFHSEQFNKLILLITSVCAIAAIPLTISRSLFFSTGVCLVFAFIGISRHPKYLSRMLIAVIGVITAFAVLSKMEFFQISTQAFTSRFENATELEGGLQGTLLDRYFGGMIGAITGTSQIPFLGYGLGMGTNAGSMLLTGRKDFLISEEEWGRLIGELGPILGILTISLRVGLCINMFRACYRKLSQGDMLPWMLLSFALLVIPQGQWAQPTTLGFGTLIGGLVIASLKTGGIKGNVRAASGKKLNKAQLEIS